MNERVSLSGADGAALDAVMGRRAGAGLRLADGDLEAVDGARVERVEGWLNVVGAARVPAASGDLLARTLAAVGEERMKFRPAAGVAAGAGQAAEKGPRRRSFLREAGAMAVAATILAAVLIPAIGQARQSYRRTLCATNLADLGTGFGMYSSANDRALPSLGASEDGNWLSPGVGGHTNTANLLPLIEVGYVSPARLICAGRGLPEGAVAGVGKSDIRDCGYSYTNLFGASKANWNGDAGTIVLADRNPLFVGAGAVNVDGNSLNHGQKGTYLLRADGHVTWETTPNVGPGGDNIWTLGSGTNRLTKYVGTEVAGSLRDVFLCLEGRRTTT